MPVEVERTAASLIVRRPPWATLARAWPWLLAVVAAPPLGLGAARLLHLGPAGTFLATAAPGVALLALRLPRLVGQLTRGALVLRRVGDLVRAGQGPALPPRAYEVMLSGRKRFLGPWVHQVTLRMTVPWRGQSIALQLLDEAFVDGDQAGQLASELGSFLAE